MEHIIGPGGVLCRRSPSPGCPGLSETLRQTLNLKRSGSSVFAEILREMRMA
jgi:hypothetical protein